MGTALVVSGRFPLRISWPAAPKSAFNGKERNPIPRDRRDSTLPEFSDVAIASIHSMVASTEATTTGGAGTESAEEMLAAASLYFRTNALADATIKTDHPDRSQRNTRHRARSLESVLDELVPFDIQPR